MIAFMAPATLPQTTIVMPNPTFTDEIALQGDTSVLFGMDGTLYSYARTTDKYLITYNFNLREKDMQELDQFLRAYYQEQWRLVDTAGRNWWGWVQDNVPTFRAHKDYYSIDLNFEGVLQ